MACALSSRKSCHLPDDWLTSSKLSIETSENGCAECNTFPLPSRVCPSPVDEPSSIVAVFVDSPRTKSTNVEEVSPQIIYLVLRMEGGRERGRGIIIDTIHHPRGDFCQSPCSRTRARSEKSSSAKATAEYVPCVSDFIISVGGTCAARRAHAAQERGELNLMRDIDELGRRPGLVRTVNGTLF